ncbi:hypothetical protein [Pseudoclavibacter terrae]|uniref:hypothetical protein n=1 Tax=Pseudoclavibacter terrae TaxID=1530195 RepID=UPI0023304D1B|nr:hypothetical protein [Pseudoclavibacter terrae]
MTTTLTAADKRFLASLREIFPDDEITAYVQEVIEADNRKRHSERMTAYHRHRRQMKTDQAAA